MTDLQHFEARLEARLRVHAAAAARPFEPSEIARAAIADGGRQPHEGVWNRLRRRLGIADQVEGERVRRDRTGRLVFALALLMIALLVTSAVIIGSRLLDEIPPPTTRPSANSFEATGSLAVARSSHTAVLLLDGRVLVIGGAVGRRETPPPSEVYDPRTGGFTSLDPIVPAFSRWDHDETQGGFSATVLADGRVLVAGGRPGDGIQPPPPTADAVLFDPATGTVTPTGPMSVARARHVAALLPDGRVLIAGGIGIGGDGTERYLASAELFDPVAEAFVPTGSMASDRVRSSTSDLTATILPSGRVLVRGGLHSGFGARAQNPDDEVFDPAAGSFASILSEAGHETGSIILPIEGRVYRYELDSGTVADLTPDPAELVRRFGHRCGDLPWDCRTGMLATGLSDGTILLTGGKVAEVEPPEHDPGRDWVPMTAGEVFDPVSGAVRATGPLVEPRFEHSATLLPDGRVVLIGGWATSSGLGRLSMAEIFTPR